MLFTDSIFLFYFLPLALILHRYATRGNAGGEYRPSARLLVFLLTLVFYGFKEPWWLLPFGVCIGFDFLWARWLARETREKHRRLICSLSIIQNISLLAIFKYWDFLTRVLLQAWPSFGTTLPQFTLGDKHLSLPPGISFYTFESLSFVIDVYRGRVKPPKKALEFFAFIGMFPRFIAGPIVRYRDLAAQFEHYQGMKIESGLFLFFWGLFLKCALADSFEVFVPYAFTPAQVPEFLSAWIGVFAYTMQIYFDFSGYSLMAIGLGRCLGFDFPANFDRPYLASSIQDFWRRWHISLSLWLKDYLYIPLGGNQKGRTRTYVNLFLTMTIGGLWHGSRWTFVVWGAWHGALLCAERAFGAQRIPPWIRRPVTFLGVMVGWIFFRVDTGLAEAGRIFLAMANPFGAGFFNSELLKVSPLAAVLAITGVMYAFFWEKNLTLERMIELSEKSWELRLAAIAMGFMAVLLAFSARLVPFLYFQF